MTATGRPPNTFWMSSGGLDSQSIAFFRTPGIELLYSGVTIKRPSVAAILVFNSSTIVGMPSAASTSPSYKGIPRMEAISTVAPAGASWEAARSSMAFKDARRRLPLSPMMLAITVFSLIL